MNTEQKNKPFLRITYPGCSRKDIGGTNRNNEESINAKPNSIN